MVQLAIGGLFLGAALGLRFKVIVLVPWTILGSIIFGFAALLIGQSALVAIACFWLALQAGYLLGSLSRITLAGARAVRSVPARRSYTPSRLPRATGSTNLAVSRNPRERSEYL